MPKAKKTESTSDSDSGPDDKAPPPPAKKSKGEPAAAKPDAGEGKNFWTLEKLRRVSISEFRGRKSIDIREFYHKDGKTLPGKKGIALSLAQWQKLLEVAELVTKAAKEE
ncbi:RNA polymerase II transcriptional coactivator [Episyrphus balteatus]|uniref:RNA polymerase II transcriptional coactivator n=1 Tax=Episyrphus balteatus TaxID=286459 RepID=UPI002486CB2E|nr:RNA polymerase II transcriptional coactivator [Episyrphus balteatus]